MMSLHSINNNTGDTPQGRTVNSLKEAGDPPEKILHAQKHVIPATTNLIPQVLTADLINLTIDYCN